MGECSRGFGELYPRNPGICAWPEHDEICHGVAIAATGRCGLNRAGAAMNRDSRHFLFLNVGHFLDHMFTLIFATVAALALTREWGVSYSATC